MSDKHLVCLNEVAEEFDMLFDGWDNYYNTKTVEFESYHSDFSEIDFDPEQRYESEEYIPLPSQYDIHEYRIMERFAEEVKDPNLKDMLTVALNGKGSFRRFKDILSRTRLLENWFSFKQQALIGVA